MSPPSHRGAFELLRGTIQHERDRSQGVVRESLNRIIDALDETVALMDAHDKEMDLLAKMQEEKQRKSRFRGWAKWLPL